MPLSKVVSYQDVALIDADGKRLDVAGLSALLPGEATCTPRGEGRSSSPGDKEYSACIGGVGYLRVRDVQGRDPIHYVVAEFEKGLITKVDLRLGAENVTLPCEPVLEALKKEWGEPSPDTSSEEALVHVYSLWETPEQTMRFDCQHYDGVEDDDGTLVDPGASEVQLTLKP